jgi:hypothetical protein
VNIKEIKQRREKSEKNGLSRSAQIEGANFAPRDDVTIIQYIPYCTVQYYSIVSSYNRLQWPSLARYSTSTGSFILDSDTPNLFH